MSTIANGANSPALCPASPLDYFPSLRCLGSADTLNEDLMSSLGWAMGRLSRFRVSEHFPSIGWEFSDDGGLSVLGNGLRLSGAEVRAIIVLLMMSESFDDSPADVLRKNFRLDNQPSTEKAGFVYLLHGVGTSFYKIGHTNSLDRRIKQISPKLPFPLDLVHWIETDDRYFVESFFHEKFAEKRKEGEWFELDVDDIDQIKAWGEHLTISELFDSSSHALVLQSSMADGPWHEQIFCSLADQLSLSISKGDRT
jgi:hypothetical protein